MNQELKNHIISLLDKGIRLDGRGPLDYRKGIKVEYDISNSAEGSARVTIGDTVVLVGIKMAIETPYPDTQDQGNLMVGAELIPMASPEFETGPPGIQAIELARVVDRGIRESKAIDVKKLCIEKGEKVWSVIIDIIPMNDAGNLFDVSALASLAALRNAKFPKVEDNVINYLEKTDESIPLNKQPTSVTVCKIGKHFIIDPISEEEKVIDARLTVATDDKNQLCAMQKGGDFSLTTEDITKMIDIAIEKCNDLRSAL